MKIVIAVTTIFFVLGMSLFVAGVYILAGEGWAMIVAAIPFIASAVILLRGVLHGEV